MSGRDDGYAMAALLVAMAVMAVMLSAAMPVWKTAATREKEAELIFRGEQYAAAIGRFQRRMGPGTLPPNLDILVEQKFLRKKYKDPMTGEDFQPVSGGQIAAGGIQPPGQQGRGGSGTGAAPQAQQQVQQAAGRAGGGFQLGGQGTQGAPIGGIVGVVSKSTETSFRLYNNRNRYNEWLFVFTQAAQGPGTQRPGEGGVNQGLPGPGGRGTGRGGVGGRGGQNPPAQGANPFGGQSPFGAGRQTAPPFGGQQPTTPPAPRR